MEKKMNILFVSGNLCDGGAQRVIAVVSSALAEKGHDVSMLLYSRNEKEYPLSSKVKVLSIGNSYEEYSKQSEIKRLKFIRRTLKEIKPDAAIGFLEGGYGLFLASFGMKVKKVASARIDPRVLLEQKGMRATINRMWFRSADAVVLQTQGQKDHVTNIPWKNKTVIANPVSEVALQCIEHDYDRPCRKIVMAGRLDEQKNYPMVLKAMERIHADYPEVTLDIFGKGAQEQALQEMITAKGLDNVVSLKGWTQNTVEEYQNSDIYVLSSDFEGMPNALMEAMAVGLPCISTDCPTGPSDLIIDGDNGYLIPVDDDIMLATRLTDLLESTEKRREMGQKAHLTLKEKFNAEVITQQWEQLLVKLVENK